MTDLHSLLARVKEAKGPDALLSAQILDAFGSAVQEFDPGDGDVLQWRVWADGTKVANPRVTASLDAALALCERVRPGCDIDLATRETMTDGRVIRTADATIYGRAYSDEKDATAYADSPALALLAALITAMMEKKKKND